MATELWSGRKHSMASDNGLNLESGNFG
jgi:hypothetical protein